MLWSHHVLTAYKNDPYFPPNYESRVFETELVGFWLFVFKEGQEVAI